MHELDAANTAYSLLRDPEVAERLGLDGAKASSLGLALVSDADAAPRLAADLLSGHARAIAEFQRQERYATAQPELDEDGRLVLTYEITGPTLRCLQLMSALRVIARSRPGASRAA
jgi:hypothetical protein